MIGVQKIFDIPTAVEFDASTLEIFRYQYQKNPVYQQFCGHLGVTATSVEQVLDIPFLPIEFFKSKKIISTTNHPQITFDRSAII